MDAMQCWVLLPWVGLQVKYHGLIKLEWLLWSIIKTQTEHASFKMPHELALEFYGLCKVQKLDHLLWQMYGNSTSSTWFLLHFRWQNLWQGKGLYGWMNHSTQEGCSWDLFFLTPIPRICLPLLHCHAVIMSCRIGFVTDTMVLWNKPN